MASSPFPCATLNNYVLTILFPVRSDATGQLFLIPGADCSKGECMAELRDDGPTAGCNSGSPELARTLQSGPLTGAAECSGELWQFSPAASRWGLVDASGPKHHCGAAAFDLRVQSNTSEKYELLGGWMSANVSDTATCAHGGRHFVSTDADFASANFSYVVELVTNVTLP